jgi:putative transposase
MPRANRYFLPGYVWHITHRCHKKEFLLKFLKDRERWIYWLYEARKRFNLTVLNYMVTSNHVHLLVYDNTGDSIIAESMQLIAGRTGQDYNQRKKRRGAFWEDRYHATAIASDKHLIHCMQYIDLNMVRARVVKHVEEWKTCGYHEIFYPTVRQKILDMQTLIQFFNLKSIDELRIQYSQWFEHNNQVNILLTDKKWSQSIAVGNRMFVDEVSGKLGYKTKFRKIIGSDDSFILKEPESQYGTHFKAKKRHLRAENTHLWNLTR